jgi:predicted  nucleic acid-binding Zn-ribbon protein
MATTSKSKADDKAEVPIEEKLKALYELQQIDSHIDKIRTIRGELPLEVRDLEDEIAGLETRMTNFTEEVKNMEDGITEKKNAIKDAQALIKKYEAQQGKVRNNREYDSITKEIEFQNLEIQLCEKRIKEFKANIAAKKEIIGTSQEQLDERLNDLKHKKEELEEIVSETRKEEEALQSKSVEAEAKIEDRLLNAYKRIRQNARNGLALVPVQRDACGGCFNKIPPQRQMDIRMHKKIIVCEHCGRILVDADILSGAEIVIAEPAIVAKKGKK